MKMIVGGIQKEAAGYSNTSSQDKHRTTAKACATIKDTHLLFCTLEYTFLFFPQLPLINTTNAWMRKANNCQMAKI